MLIYEMMSRLMAAAHDLYIALGKAMVIPSWWCYDTVALSLAAKMIAGTLAKLLWDNLNFDGDAVLYQSEPAVSVKFLGKVVESISCGVWWLWLDLQHFGSKQSCWAWGYQADFNNFQCNEPVIVDLPQSSGCSLMEMVNVKVGEICKEKSEYSS
ncbi:unnamed protein product [Sphagnum balticum]